MSIPSCRCAANDAPLRPTNLERSFDAAGRLTLFKDHQRGLTEAYEYRDVLGRLTKKTRTVTTLASASLVMVETYQYNDQHRWVVVSREIDTGTATGKRTETETLSFDGLGRMRSRERTVAGQPAIEEFTYDPRGQLLTHKTATGALTQWFYDPVGNLVRMIDPEGKTTNYFLDDAGRVDLEKGPHPDYEADYDYDELGRLKLRTVKKSGTTPEAKWTYLYVVNEAKTIESIKVGEDDSIATERTYNGRGRVVTERVTGPGGVIDSHFTFEGPWEKRHVVTEGGWTNTTEVKKRDDRGRILEEEERWSPSGTTNFYTYRTEAEWSGRTAELTLTDTTQNETQRREHSLQVDSLGNLVELTQGDSTARWIYDAAGVLSEERPAGAPSTLYVYEEGLLASATYAETETTEYTYWPDGRLHERIEPSGRVASYSYWPRGQVKDESYGSGNQTQTTHYAYDENGQVVAVTAGYGSPDAQTWSYGRGARGELLSATQPGSVGKFEYTYDALLRLMSVEPPTGSKIPRQTFTYDFVGRPRTRTRGSATWNTSWTGGKATTTDPNNDVTEVLHDGRGRPSRVVYQPGGSAAHTELASIEYEFTASDQPWRIAEERDGGDVVNTFEYDVRGLLKSVNRGGQLVSYGYTDSGQRRTVNSPNGSAIYGYDALDRLSSLTSSRGITRFEWEAGGARLLAVKDSALVERRCYDGQGRLEAVINAGTDISCENRQSASLLHSRFEYSYDGRGNRKTETYRDGVLTQDEVTEYGYDAADRLTGVRYPDGTAVLYALAPDGTRLEEAQIPNHLGGLGPDAFTTSLASRHLTYEIDPLGGLKGVDDGLTGNRLATYDTDPAGRVRAIVTATGRKDFGWDAAGRLRQVTVASGVAGEGGATLTASYLYGYDGLRRAATVGPQTTRYLWADGELVEEQIAATPLVYERAGALTTAVGADRVAHDALGSAVGMVGASQTTHRFDAWGNYRTDKPEWSIPGSAQASLGYTGHAFAAESGLVYAQQRWLDTNTGRFLSEDPVLGDLANPVSLNAWGYANANAPTYTDPDGQFVNVAVGAIAGGVIGCGLGAWSAESGSKLEGCLKSGAIGIATGALAGATFGVTFAATAGIGSATIAGSTGSALIATTAAGAVGAYTSAFASSYYLEGKTFAESNRAGIFAAPLGALGGVLGYGLGQAAGALAGRAGANGLFREGLQELVEESSDDLISQGLAVHVGLQDEMSYLNPLAWTGALRSFRGTRYLVAEHFAPQFSPRRLEYDASLMRGATAFTGIPIPVKTKALSVGSDGIRAGLPLSVARSLRDRIANVRAADFQDHHIISNKHPATRNHPLLKLANFDLNSRANMILLPTHADAHSWRSIHRGRHLGSVSQRLGGRMNALVRLGKAEGWGTERYAKELRNLIRNERRLLLSGERALNKNRREWSELE